MSACTRETLTEVIARYGGVLKAGAHQDHRACCILEARAVCLGLPWTDDPAKVGLPDIRPIHDGPWESDVARTEEMITLADALDGWATWSVARQQAWATRVAIETVRQIIADLPGLPETIRAQCRAADSLATAATAWAAAWAATAAVLRRACAIWITAAHETEGL